MGARDASETEKLAPVAPARLKIEKLQSGARVAGKNLKTKTRLWSYQMMSYGTFIELKGLKTPQSLSKWSISELFVLIFACFRGFLTFFYIFYNFGRHMQPKYHNLVGHRWLLLIYLILLQ